MTDSHKPRIALYSHDTMGLGHVRRNLLIAQMLSKSDLQPEILMLSGALEAETFAMPKGTDCVVLPSLYKEPDGRYRPRRLNMSLPELIDLRRKILHTSISTFDPDILIVDGVPWGAGEELDTTLEYLRRTNHTRCVLGMRDVWDEPSVIKEEWSKRRNMDAIRKYYDEVWIYGDPAVYDTIREYDFGSDVANKVRYTGYLHQATRLEFAVSDEHTMTSRLQIPESPFALCMIGGGQDGARLAETFVQAELPDGRNGVVVLGPHMDPNSRLRLHEYVENNDRLRILDFLPEPVLLLQHADCVVAMGGYNTLCEIMSFKKRALIVPRVSPRKEQLIRAQRLQALGVLDVLHPSQLEPLAITRWLEHNAGRVVENIKADMNGLLRVNMLLRSLLSNEHFARTT